MVSSFKSHYESLEQELSENTLYTTAQEREDLVKDQDRVMMALVYNFFGILGLLNGVTKQPHRTMLINFLKKDKQLRLNTIGDDNHDLSLVIKLAHEAGLFKNEAVVNQITRFLVKLKTGQIKEVDTKQLFQYIDQMKPNLVVKLKNPKVRAAWRQFVADKGDTLDVSWLAIQLKKQALKVPESGEFRVYAKRFHALKAKDLSQPTAVIDTSSADGSTDVSPTLAPAAKKPTPPKDVVPDAPKVPKLWDAKRLYNQTTYDYITSKVGVTAGDDRALDYVTNLYPDRQQSADLYTHDRPLSQEVLDTRPIVKLAIDAVRYGSQQYYEFDGGKDSKYKEYQQRWNDLNAQFAKYGVKTQTYEWALNSVYNTADQPSAQMAMSIIMWDTFPPSGWGGSIKNAEDRALAALTGRADGVRTLFQLFKERISRDQKDVINTKSVWEKVMRVISKVPGNLLSDIPDWVTPIFEKVVSTSSWSSASSTDKAIFALLIDQQGITPDILIDLIGATGRYSAGDMYIALLMADSTTPGELWKFGRVPNPAGDYPWVDWSGTATKWMEAIKAIPAKRPEQAFKTAFRAVQQTSVSYKPNAPLCMWLKATQEKTVYGVPPLESKYIKSVGDAREGYFSGNTVSIESVGKLWKLADVDVDRALKGQENSIAGIELIAQDKSLSGLTDEQIDIWFNNMLATKKDRPINVGANVVADAKIFVDRYTSGDDAREGYERLFSRVADDMQINPKAYDNSRTMETIVNLMPSIPEGTTGKLVRAMRDQKMNYGLTLDTYKQIHKTDKQRFVNSLTGAILDSIGTDYEDYLNEVFEQYPTHVKLKARSSLVGADTIVHEVAAGVIQPFDKIDSARLKKMFEYNDVDFSGIVTANIGKKGKKEKYTEFFARTRKAIAARGNVLPDPMVEEDPDANLKSLTKVMIERDHAGKHGDTYPIIRKAFNSTMRFPEFEQFRKDNPNQDPEIVPAYHGTGGIAATMILRYGFRVIQASDSSVVGRMLGNGIYFSNKIDKVIQYVSNGGYGRRYGSKGYVFLMDNNLGERGRNYSAAGLGRDAIRSPEWCVFDPRAQLQITKVYEIELNSGERARKFIAEGNDSKMNSFLTEARMRNTENTHSFIFRDGMIPIISADDKIRNVDFEIALKKKLITRDMIEGTHQGPMIVFRGTEDTRVWDYRYVSNMTGDGRRKYIEGFRNKMLT